MACCCRELRRREIGAAPTDGPGQACCCTYISSRSGLRIMDHEGGAIGSDAGRRLRQAGIPAERVSARAAHVSEDMRPIRPGMNRGQNRPLTDAGLEMVHQSAPEVIGLSDAPESRAAILTGAGVIPGSDRRIRFSRALFGAPLAGAARNVTLLARDPKHDLLLSGSNVYFGTAAAAVDVVASVTPDYPDSTAHLPF